MKDIIDDLMARKDVLTKDIAEREVSIDDYETRIIEYKRQNARAEESIDGIEAAVAVLGGKVKRRQLRRGKPLVGSSS